MAIRKAAQAWLVIVAVLLAASLAPAVFGQAFQGITMKGGGGGSGAGVQIGASLSENGTAPTVMVKTNLGIATEVRVDAKLGKKIGSFRNVSRAVVAQDTVGTSHKVKHILTGSTPTWIASEGDTVKVWVRSYNATGTLVDATLETIILDAPGDLQDYVYRSSHSIATAAVDSGWVPAAAGWATVFDDVTNDADGTTMKYGAVRRDGAYTDSTTFTLETGGRVLGSAVTQHAEDDGTIAAAQLHTFIWFDMTNIPANAKVAEAWLYTSTNLYGGVDVTAPGYMACRLDTVAQDLRMIDTLSPRSLDPRVMNVSWNEPQKGRTTVWNPTLVTRLDWHDFGPQSSNRLTWDLASGGQAIRFNMTDAVQQWVSNKRGLRNGPFVLTGYNATALNISIGNHATDTRGNPFLVVRWVDGIDHVNPWGDGELVPLVLSMDDGADEQKDWADSLLAYGYDPTMVVYRDMLDTAGKYTTAQLRAILAAGGDFAGHSTTHPSLGALTTPQQFHNQLQHAWYDTALAPAVFDSTATEYADFAWPLQTIPGYSRLALDAIIDHDYRSARAFVRSDSPIGPTVKFGLDKYVNLYMIESILPDNIVGATPTNGKGAIKEELEDHIDEYYYDHGRSPIVLYVHNDTQDITSAQVGYICQLADEMSSFGIVSLQYLVERRIAGQSYVLPNNAFADACYDSLYQLGDTRMAEVWLPPFNQ